MIPKIIHYCWFGGKSKSPKIQKYIDSWVKAFPDFKIIEWNEKNFDVESSIYTRDAYQAKKYAFVSDYVRLWALNCFGGIYFDTDIQVINSFEKLLKYQGIFGFEESGRMMTAFMATEKNNKIISDFFKCYEKKKFDIDDLEPNTVLFTKILMKYGLKLNGENQKLVDGNIVFSMEYFHAYDFKKSKFIISQNTYTIHHCCGSWCPVKQRLAFKFTRYIAKNISEIHFEKLKKIKKKILG